MVLRNSQTSVDAPSTTETMLSQAMKFAQARERLPDTSIIDPAKRALIVAELKQEKPNLKALLPKICSDIFIVCRDKDRLYAIVRDANNYMSIPMNGPHMLLLITDYFFNHSGQYLPEHIVEPYYMAQKYISSKSAFDVPIVKRAARTDSNAVEINLAKDGKVVEVDSTGYRVKTQLQSECQFRTLSPAHALFEPVQQGQGDIKPLWTFANIKTQESQLLLTASMLFTFWGNGGYPFVCFIGQAGSGKSESARFVIRLIDNSPVHLRALSENDTDLVIACNNSHVVGFDNISDISEKLSNKLCMVVTGATHTTRKLYTNDEEAYFYLSNPLFATSIALPVTKADLMDRAIALQCDRFDETSRVSQSELDKAFEHAAPVIMGGLFELLSKTIGIMAEFKSERVHRLADFSIFGQCVAIALGQSPDHFLTAFEASQKRMATSIGESDCLLEPLMKMLSRQTGNTWTGNTTKLLEQIAPRTKPRDWPISAAAAGKRLIALQPVLKLMGVDYQVVESGKRKVIITVTDKFDPNGYNALCTTPPAPKPPILRFGGSSKPKLDSGNE